MSAYYFVFLTVFSTVASQILFKFGVERFHGLKSMDALLALMNFHILGGLFFSLVSILSWMAAISRLTLGQAYPFMSLSFPLVLLSSLMFFGEGISAIKWFGLALIVLGLIIMSRYG